MIEIDWRGFASTREMASIWRYSWIVDRPLVLAELQRVMVQYRVSQRMWPRYVLAPTVMEGDAETARILLHNGIAR